MIRLGVAGTLDSFHANCVCSLVNGVTRRPQQSWGVFGKMPELAGFTVNAVYDPDRARAEDAAAAFSVPHVAGSPGEMAGLVDGVLIVCDKDQTDHYRLAPAFLERRLPVYVDKPFAGTAEEALGVVRVARRSGTPVLSCSARRFDPLIVGGAAILRKECTGLLAAYAFGDWRYEKMIWYGVHAVDVLFAVLGPDVVAVRETGDARHRMIRLAYRDGLVATVDLLYDAGTGTSVVVFGRGAAHNPHWVLGTGRTPVFFAALVERIGAMIQSGQPPVPYAEMVHVIRVLNAAEQSLAEGREIAVDMREPEAEGPGPEPPRVPPAAKGGGSPT
jgi:predicted dehydrogenase